MIRLIITVLCMIIMPCCAYSQKSGAAQRMEVQGLKNIAKELPEVRISLMYTRADNFTGKVLYKYLTEAYLHPITMEALRKADQRLRALRPDLRLMVMDATRPMSVQQVMWDTVKNTDKRIYVSNPKNGGGLHNYGLAVDVTLCRVNGDTLTMGVKIDNMTRLSHIDKEDELLKQGKISKEAYDNRRLLREVMQYGGFKPLRTEWWHFNIRTRSQAKQYFKVVR